MSYEGYEQKLCKNGHYWTVDAFENYCGFDNDGFSNCPCCKEKEVWSNSVDTTNGSFEWIDGKEVRIDGYIELEEATPAPVCTCKECGNVHALGPPTYKIPKNLTK